MQRRPLLKVLAAATAFAAASLTLPANSSMSWTLLVPVVPTSSDPTITLRIDVGGDVNPANASDVNTLVIFRNGLQVPGDTQ